MITCTFEDGGKGLLRHVTMTALVVRQNQILLVKRAEHLLNGGKYGLPGGFLNRDETVLQGAVREIYEETGYKITNIQLFRMNDNPQRANEDRQNVDFVFLATALEKTGQADKESSEVSWFDLEKLPVQEEFAFDHFENIQLFLQFQKEKFSLPILPTK